MSASWRTSLLGILGLVAALTSAVSDALQGNPINYTVVITAFTTGIGLLNARDNKVSSEQAGIK